MTRVPTTITAWDSCYALSLFDRLDGVPMGLNDQRLIGWMQNKNESTHSFNSIRTLGRLSTDAARRRC
jgi:hypothetical protein